MDHGGFAKALETLDYCRLSDVNQVGLGASNVFCFPSSKSPSFKFSDGVRESDIQFNAIGWSTPVDGSVQLHFHSSLCSPFSSKSIYSSTQFG